MSSRTVGSVVLALSLFMACSASGGGGADLDAGDEAAVDPTHDLFPDDALAGEELPADVPPDEPETGVAEQSDSRVPEDALDIPWLDESGTEPEQSEPAESVDTLDTEAGGSPIGGPCATGSDCSSGICQQVTLKCVECVVAADCADQPSGCAGGACEVLKPCADGTECDSGVCDPGQGACVACLEDKHCGLDKVCLGHQCFPEPPPCSGLDPCGPGLACDQAKGICVGCVTSADCPPDRFCDYPECKPWICIPASNACQGGKLSTCAADGGSYASTLSCDDGNPCTAGDGCSGNKCAATSPIDCDDGNDCTADSCLPATGCQHVPVTGVCDDGDPCTAGDQCAGGSCIPSGPLSCDDGNPCTADSCLPASGCLHTPVAGGCDDGDPCTEGDSCFQGACAGGGEKDCKDLDPCTSDSCQAATGDCLHEAVAGCGPCVADAGCDDGIACSLDTCPAGECVHETAPGCCGSDPACDDGDPCTSDSCSNPPFGTCGHAILPGQACCAASGFLADFGGGEAPGFALDPPVQGVGWHVVESPWATSGSWALYYGNPASKTYDNGAANSGAAHGPPIPLPPGVESSLAFWTWQDVEDLAALDVLTVEALVGQKAIKVWSRPKGFPMEVLNKVTVDISPLAGKTIVLRFSFATKDAVGNSGEGVYVDDVSVSSTCKPKACQTPQDCKVLGASGLCEAGACDFGAVPAPASAFGTGGAGAGELDTPFDVAASPDGKKLYVSDRLNHRVQVFDDKGKHLFSLGQFGSMDGQFIQPRGLCLGGGKLWVADTQNNRIEVFTPAGAFLSKFGTKGSEPGQMYEPKDVALSPDATTLYVADTSNHRVQGFDLDGNPLFSWGKYGKAEGDFRSPSCVVVSQAGEVWVCDVQNHRIQVFGPGGQFAGKLQPTGQAAFYYPYGLWVAEDGMTVFVSDTYNHRVQVFDIAWQVLAQIGDVGSGIGQWQYPMGMAAGPGGLLYVVDSGNDRVVAMGPGQ